MKNLMDVEIIGGKRKKSRKRRTSKTKKTRRRRRKTRKLDLMSVIKTSAAIAGGMLLMSQIKKINDEAVSPLDEKVLYAIVPVAGGYALTKMKMSAQNKKYFEPIILGASASALALLLSKFMEANVEGTSGSYETWTYRPTGGIAYSLPMSNNPDVVSAIV